MLSLFILICINARVGSASYIYQRTVWKHPQRSTEQPFCPHLSWHNILHSTVIKVEDQDILRAYADELIHHIGHLGPLYHRADSNPISVF